MSEPIDELAARRARIAVYERALRTLRAMTPEQLDDFERKLRVVATARGVKVPW